MKYLKFLLVLILMGCVVSSFSQQKVLDSLLVELEKVDGDKKKVALLNAIASEYIENDPEKMMDYAEKALVLSQEKGLKDEEADSWLNIGNANIMMSRYTEALKSFSNSKDILEELLNSNNEINEAVIKSALARAYGSIGVVYSEQNNYAGALEYYFKSLRIYQEAKEEDIVLRLYNNIGIVYKTNKEYDKALDYFKKALEVQERIGDNTSAITITNIGNIYLLQDK